MRSELAEELLDHLMGWDADAFQEEVRRLEALATYKFDEYGNFRPGIKFFESLAAWLDQLDDQGERATALNFVLDRLIFVSDAEMTHLIELVYPDHIEQVLRSRVAAHVGGSQYAVARIVGSDAFRALRRRSLILGASDGARLDRLRRSAPFLSHEQFLQSAEPPRELIKPMCGELAKALAEWSIDAPATFEHIFLIDDFSGSGETLLRVEKGEMKGKLIKLAAAIEGMREDNLISDQLDVTVILYLASEAAKTHLDAMIADSPLPDWRVRVVQELPAWIRVDQQAMEFAALCEKYYDGWFTDSHKGPAPLGYARGALPVVLSHNTPNNSASLLWADSTAEETSLRRRALFPRYERHHRDRP